MNCPNTAAARRWFEEMWNERKEHLAHEILEPEAACESTAGILVGAEPFLERVYRPFLAAFPDLKIEVEETVTEGDRVAILWRATGTHTGEGLGIPPSGKRISLPGMSFMRCRDGRFVAGRDAFNLGGLLAELAS